MKHINLILFWIPVNLFLLLRLPTVGVVMLISGVVLHFFSKEIPSTTQALSDKLQTPKHQKTAASESVPLTEELLLAAIDAFRSRLQEADADFARQLNTFSKKQDIPEVTLGLPKYSLWALELKKNLAAAQKTLQILFDPTELVTCRCRGDLLPVVQIILRLLERAVQLEATILEYPDQDHSELFCTLREILQKIQANLKQLHTFVFTLEKLRVTASAEIEDARLLVSQESLSELTSLLQSIKDSKAISATGTAP